ncbi:MAG: hypothetical protein RIT07_91 [Bacteroidota bacterium]
MTKRHTLGLVHAEGLEPPRLAAPDPKSGAATNYATRAETILESPYLSLTGLQRYGNIPSFAIKFSIISNSDDGYAILISLFIFQRDFNLPARTGLFFTQF